ncbi:MAG: Ig-like domain-containing protein [Gemmatimonadaceae bacterium]|nr:Ig-like domain-containing protein [Gemmatimonadaceae bacterium]
MRVAARAFPLAVLAGVLAGVLACASASTPPGGPETYDPPRILRMRPDTNAVNVRGGSIAFDFDKVINERPMGASSLAGLFLISPSYGEPSVSWRRDFIAVSPKGGFRANTTYHVRMLPGLTDLEGNVDSVTREFVFSTGPVIAKAHIRGNIFDWQSEKPGQLALIEAFPIPTSKDSLRYLTLADSLGRFDLANLPVGEYLLRGIIDQNKNRLLDPRELYDTMKVALVDSARREILAYVHDTIGVGIQTVTLMDSMTIRLQLDRALDTAFVIDASHFSLKKRDSSVVAIARTQSRQAYDLAQERGRKTKAIQDSLRRAAKEDSSRADSAKRDSAKAPAPPPPPTNRRTLPPRRAQIDSAIDRLTGRDTVAKEPPPKPSKPSPVNELIITTAAPLAPGTQYRIRAVELPSLLRRRRSSERVFSTPKPKVDTTKKDTTKAGGKAKADSAAARDTVGAPGGPEARGALDARLRHLLR